MTFKAVFLDNFFVREYIVIFQWLYFFRHSIIGSTYALSIVYVVLIQAIVLALGYLIPYFAQVGKSMDSFAAGCLLLPGCIIGALLTPFGGGILDRVADRKSVV